MGRRVTTASARFNSWRALERFCAVENSRRDRRRSDRPFSRRVGKGLWSIVIVASSLIVLSPSTASAKGVLGTGVGWCANAENGGRALQNHYVSTVGGRVYACGPVPVDGYNDTGPAIPPFWPTENEGGFQCTELAIRYLYAATDGVDYVHLGTQNYWDGAGKDFVSQVAPHFHAGPIGEHRNGVASSERPQIGDILSEMASPGESYADANAAARTYGDVGIVTGVNSARITLLVQNNNETGINYVNLNSPTSWSINAKGGNFYYTSFKWFSPTATEHVAKSPPVRLLEGLPVPPTNPVAMPSSNYSYAIYGTPTLKEFDQASTSATVAGTLPEGQSVNIQCQGDGPRVKRSSVWDQLTNGDWVSDYYVNTPNVGTYSPPIPLCVTPRSVALVVRSTLHLRSGPSSSDHVVESPPSGTSLDVVCQTTSLRGAKWDYVVDQGDTPIGYEPADDLLPAKSAGQQPSVPDCPAVLSAVTSTSPNLIQDPEFGSPVISGGFQTFKGGTMMGPWHVTGNSVDLNMVDFLGSFDGANQDVDLSGTNYSGNSAGGLYQDVATVPGRHYVLSFEEDANSQGAPTVKSLSVSFAGKVLATDTYDDVVNDGYIEHTYDVIATSATSRVAFTSNTYSLFGPLLGEVSLKAATT